MGKYDSGLTAKDSGGSFEIAPAGVHLARCFQVIDLGIQNTPFKDDDGLTKTQLQVRLVWELLGLERQENGKPFTVMRDFTNSLNEKSNLFGFLESWRGKKFEGAELDGFELTNVLGSYCQLQVMHIKSNKGGDYAIAKTALPAAGDVPVGKNPAVAFNIMDWDQEVFDSLPGYTQNKIKESLTYKYEVEGKSDEPQEDPLNPVDPPLDTVHPIDDGETISLDDIPF